MANKSTATTKTQSSDELTKLVAELHEEMQSVRKELKALAGAAGGAAKSELSALTQAVPENAKELLHKAEAATASAAKQAKARIVTAEETVEAQVSEHPWRTLGVVGLAGLALGLLIRR